MTVKEGHSLHIAAASGDVFSVRAFLDQGMDVNAVDASGNTALHHAVWAGHLETARVLIGCGADFNAKRVVSDVGNAWTPLHLAAVNDWAECAHLLLDAGADPDPKDEYGQTPLFLAADQEYNHGAKRADLVAPDVARLLIEHGASIRGTNVHQTWTGVGPDAGIGACLEALEMIERATQAME